MKWLFAFLLCVIVIAVISSNQQPPPEPVAVRQPVAVQQAITPNGPLIKRGDANMIASDFYGHDFILEFEPGGSPFQTTESSKIANRRTRLAIISEMKLAASRQDEQIAADINLLQVLSENHGDYYDKEVATNKLAKDLKKFQYFDYTPTYDINSPWGWIIAEMESFLASDDERERKDRAEADAIRKAKSGAGIGK